jgi:hypothetical protein
MTADTKVRQFLEQDAKRSIPIKNYFTVFEHTHNATESSQFVTPKTFDWVPD